VYSYKDENERGSIINNNKEIKEQYLLYNPELIGGKIIYPETLCFPKEKTTILTFFITPGKPFN
jgi:hypothetical protein